MRNKTKRERCREYLPCGAGCTGHVPKVKDGALTTERQLEAFACLLLHLCRYCYRMRFPERPETDKPKKQGKRCLTPYEREFHEKRQFEGMETLIWSPEFHRDWKDYLKDKWGD